MRRSPSLQSMEIQELAMSLVQQFSVFYGEGSAEMKRQAELTIEQITQNALFPQCYL